MKSLGLIILILVGLASVTQQFTINSIIDYAR